MRIRSLLLPAAAAIVVLVVALAVRSQPVAAGPPSAHATASGPVRSGHVTVAISNYAFVPKDLTVKVGTRVSWANHDATAHTATADSGTGLDTGTVNPHATKTVDFSHPGSFTYHCAFHAFMTATIIVKP